MKAKKNALILAKLLPEVYFCNDRGNSGLERMQDVGYPA